MLVNTSAMNCQDSYIMVERHMRWGSPPKLSFMVLSTGGQITAKLDAYIQWSTNAELQPSVIIECFEYEGELEAMTMRSIVITDSCSSANLWSTTGRQLAMATWNSLLTLVRVSVCDSPNNHYEISGLPFCNSRKIHDQKGEEVLAYQKGARMAIAT